MQRRDKSTDPFAKLSERQWRMLIDLLWGEQRLSIARRVVRRGWRDAVTGMPINTESDRVATIRALTSLQRRGLIVPVGRSFDGMVYKLAVSPRAVLGAAVRLEPRCLMRNDKWALSDGMFQSIRRSVERIEREQWIQRRREAMAERRRQKAAHNEPPAAQ
jgi:hypothetical protein